MLQIRYIALNLKPTIMKDNKLIAEFMGWDILSPTTIPPSLHLSNLEVNNGEIPNF